MTVQPWQDGKRWGAAVCMQHEGASRTPSGLGGWIRSVNSSRACSVRKMRLAGGVYRDPLQHVTSPLAQQHAPYSVKLAQSLEAVRRWCLRAATFSCSSTR